MKASSSKQKYKQKSISESLNYVFQGKYLCNNFPSNTSGGFGCVFKIGYFSVLFLYVLGDQSIHGSK